MTDEDRRDLLGGTYAVTITDANGCTTALNDLVVSEPDALTLDAAITDASCDGGATGAIDLTVRGGTAGYRFRWSHGPSTEDVDDLTAGSYTVTVTDARGCMTERSFQVESAGNLPASFVATDVRCFAEDNGTIDVTVSGGTPGYTFAWSDGGPATEDRTDLRPGTYSVTITDVGGCSTILEDIAVRQPEPIMITVDRTLDVTCAGGDDGGIFVSAAGGNGNYDYRWDDGGDGPERANLRAGDYVVTVSDANGCTGEARITVGVGEDLSFLLPLLPDTVLCTRGRARYDLTSVATGLTIAWTLPDGDRVTGPVLDTDQAGTHRVSIRSDAGCTLDAEFMVAFAGSNFMVDFLLADRALVDDPTVAIDISFPVPDSVDWFWVDPDITDLGVTANQQTLSFAEPGRYEIGMTAYRDGCSGTVLREIEVFTELDSLLNYDTLNVGMDLRDVTLAPNPHRGRFQVTVELTRTVDTEFFVFDNGGTLLERRLIRPSQPLFVESFDLPGLPAGIHTLVVRTATGIVYLRHVKAD